MGTFKKKLVKSTDKTTQMKKKKNQLLLPGKIVLENKCDHRALSQL